MPVFNTCTSTYSSAGMTYVLTCVDRYSRWPEAIPIPNCTSETVARAFLERWIAQFGCPTVVTTDRGTSFAGSFDAMLQEFGVRHTRTTPRHPQCNGLVERFHRPLKAALCAQGNPSWTEALPLVLLGLRTVVKEDLSAAVSELAFGCTLRLPGELVKEGKTDLVNSSDFVERLRKHMRQLRPVERRLEKQDIYIPDALFSSSHVFIRADCVKPPLTPPYSGPFKIIQRSDFSFRYRR